MNTLVTVLAMSLVGIIGFIVRYVYDLMMLIKHKPTKRYVSYGDTERTADAVVVVVGVVGLLINWFNKPNWTTVGWVMMSITVICISLVIAPSGTPVRVRGTRIAISGTGRPDCG